MKLRILDDSLRLRLPKGEVDQLRASGRVEAAIHFGPGPRQRLVYALVVAPDAQRMSAVITESEIAVHLPEAVVPNTQKKSAKEGDERQFERRPPRPEGEGRGRGGRGPAGGDVGAGPGPPPVPPAARGVRLSPSPGRHPRRASGPS